MPRPTRGGPVPIPSSAYGSADEESNRVYRRREGTLPGTRIGIPGRSDSPQDRNGKWEPGPIRRKR
jgi:hypothetical protein